MIFVFILLAIYFASILVFLIYIPIRRGMREEKGIQNSWEDENEFGDFAVGVFLWPFLLALVLLIGPFYATYWCLVKLGKYIARKSSK